jgi:uncharacterized protein YkwD
MHQRPTALAAAALSAALLAAIPTPAEAAPCAGGDIQPTASNLPQVRHATLCLLNQQRRSRGLKRLRSNAKLRRAATAYSRQMAAAKFFAHVSPGGSTLLGRVRRTAYLSSARGWALGENIAWGAGSLASPRKTVRAWMNSPGHKRNILTARFRHIGIGVVPRAPVPLPSGLNAATYTTNFGTRG